MWRVRLLHSNRKDVSHHIPDKVCQPVQEGLHPADELHVLGLVHSLLDEEDHEAGGDEGHGEDHADGNQHVHRCRHPERAQSGGVSDHASKGGGVKYFLNVGGSYSQRHLGQLLLGEVEGMVVGGDAKLCWVVAALQTRPQDAVVHHVEERADAVPALVVEPDLGGGGTERMAAFLVSVTSGKTNKAVRQLKRLVIKELPSLLKRLLFTQRQCTFLQHFRVSSYVFISSSLLFLAKFLFAFLFIMLELGNKNLISSVF